MGPVDFCNQSFTRSETVDHHRFLVSY